jgi:hypothetical protein
MTMKRANLSIVDVVVVVHLRKQDENNTDGSSDSPYTYIPLLSHLIPPQHCTIKKRNVPPQRKNKRNADNNTTDSDDLHHRVVRKPSKKVAL